MTQTQVKWNDRRFSWTSSIPERVFLALILLAELWLFTGAFHKFFTHDSLFYMINAPDSWEQFRPQLIAPSAERSYRPLNLGFVALLRPYLGTDPRPYHWIPIIFHLLNTCIFFALAKRLLPSLPAALAAAGFWGLHSVAGWITYDITYLSDFLLAFLLLASLLLAVDGRRLKSRPRIMLSVLAFVLALITKEAAITFPLALWISLGLAELRQSERPSSRQNTWDAFRKTLPLASLYFFIACAFAGLFIYWFLTGSLYAQGSSAAYDINPWANLSAKAKYGYWSLNLPDALSIPNAQRNHILAMGLMLAVCAVWLLDILRRRFRLSVIEWSGIVWLAGLNIPAFLLSHRLAKWYLYLPLFGLALAFGVLVENLRTKFPGIVPRISGLIIAGLLLGPIVFVSHVQTRSYIANSDSSYQSDLLQACLEDFKATHPTLPPGATLYFLPAFEEGVSDLLSAPPIDRGGLFQMYYPGTRVQVLFAHKGHRLPENIGARSDVFVLQYLDRHLYDVTKHFADSGKMTLFLLPTFEGKIAPLLKKTPAGGRKLYDQYVQMLFSDEGAVLPDNYYKRSDLWILQYLNGRFGDVTGYYLGRHRDGATRVAQSLEGVQYSVNRAERYPNYDHFETPTGAPVFFQTAEKEILTQIGGSTVVVPLYDIPPDAELRFDVSWMFESGDGGWAEAAVRTGTKETVVFREHRLPNPKMSTLLWKEIKVDLRPFAKQRADLILRCYNDPGRNTIADWLNWRDISIATSK